MHKIAAVVVTIVLTLAGCGWVYYRQYHQSQTFDVWFALALCFSPLYAIAVVELWRSKPRT